MNGIMTSLVSSLCFDAESLNITLLTSRAGPAETLLYAARQQTANISMSLRQIHESKFWT